MQISSKQKGEKQTSTQMNRQRVMATENAKDVSPFKIRSCLNRAIPTRDEVLSGKYPSSESVGAIPLYHEPTKICGMKIYLTQCKTSGYC